MITPELYVVESAVAFERDAPIEMKLLTYSSPEAGLGTKSIWFQANRHVSHSCHDATVNYLVVAGRSMCPRITITELSL